MMQSSIFRDNNENNDIPSGRPDEGRGGDYNSQRRSSSTMRRGTTALDDSLQPSQPSSSYLCSFCRWCCTFQHFCYVVQLVNCGLLCGLIYLIIREYPKLQTLDELDDLQKQIDEDHAEIAALKYQVNHKQEGQLVHIEESLKQEQRNNFLTLAGIFTLLTCLISMFHMTTHVQKLNQPKIQRKIIAILWMSPIYSVTSFLTLIYPPLEGWMAIIKDFYESYCIYVFLSFLIAVLGEGSRDKAVEVLAKHADHLDQPTRCLGCLYEPPPDTSDHAKANAVMTQCQIYCLQFTLIRPITTIIRVFVLQRDKKQAEESVDENLFQDEGDGVTGNSYYESNSQTNSSDFGVDEPSSSIGTDIGEEARTASPTPSSTNAPSDANTDNGGAIRRRLERTPKRQDRWLQIEEEGEDTLNDDDKNGIVEFPSIAPANGADDNQFPTFFGNDNSSPTTVPMEGMPMFPPTSFPDDTDPLAPTTFSPISAAIPGSENDGMPSFGYNNNTGFDGMYTSNTTNDFSSTMLPTMTPSVPSGVSTDVLVDQTKAYFRSPGFALAMVVNVSIFFAFSGLLKLYHAVREDLLWCRPFPKFLTIKAVVFLTFWQGLAITIYFILTADPNQTKEEAALQAHRYQNLLICVEMLLVAISQWCVFPAIEWEPNYEPRKMHTPGLGIKDFVSDVGQIVKNSSSKKRRRRKKRGGEYSSKSGLYHMPGFASMVSSQFDGFGGAGGRTRADSSFDDEESFESSNADSSRDRIHSDDIGEFENNSSFERSNADDNTGIAIHEYDKSPYSLPSAAPQENGERIRSDDLGKFSIEDDGSDNDMELL